MDREISMDVVTCNIHSLPIFLVIMLLILHCLQVSFELFYYCSMIGYITSSFVSLPCNKVS